MLRTEMIELLKTGRYNIRHQNAGEEEFFYMKNGVITDHDGYRFGGIYDEFLEIRKGDWWEDNWLAQERDDDFTTLGSGAMLIRNYHNEYREVEPFIYLDDEKSYTKNSMRRSKIKGNARSFKGGKSIDWQPRNLISRNDPCPCGCGKKSKHCKNENW